MAGGSNERWKWRCEACVGWLGTGNGKLPRVVGEGNGARWTRTTGPCDPVRFQVGGERPFASRSQSNRTDGGGLEPHGLATTHRLATGDRTFRRHHPRAPANGARRTRTAAASAHPPSKRGRCLIASRSRGRRGTRTPGAQWPHPYSKRGRHLVDSPSALQTS